MPDDAKAAALARQAFVAAHGGDADAVGIVSVRHELIPNPPLGPGQISIDPVRYRYFVELRSAGADERYRVEGNHVYRS